LPLAAFIFIASTNQAIADGTIESASPPGQAQPQPHVFNERGSSTFGFGPIDGPNTLRVDAATKGFFKTYQGLQPDNDDLRIWFDKNKRQFTIAANKEPSFGDFLKGRPNADRAAWFFAEAKKSEEEQNLVLSARLHQESLRLIENENQPVLRRNYIQSYIGVIKKLGYENEARKLERIFEFDKQEGMLPRPRSIPFNARRYAPRPETK
jgi:hypothetical protein